jgi:hypothetical protein
LLRFRDGGSLAGCIRNLLQFPRKSIKVVSGMDPLLILFFLVGVFLPCAGGASTPTGWRAAALWAWHTAPCRWSRATGRTGSGIRASVLWICAGLKPRRRCASIRFHSPAARCASAAPPAARAAPPPQRTSARPPLHLKQSRRIGAAQPSLLPFRIAVEIQCPVCGAGPALLEC